MLDRRLMFTVVPLAWMGMAPTAWACLSCSCAGSGSPADLGPMGGASSLFAQGQHWLVQEAVQVRGVTGSFNERGDWRPVPTDGSLTSVSNVLGVTYFPASGVSLGVQAPLVANRLDGAAWGPMGSIAPTDTGRTTAAALGDVMLQGSYRLAEFDDVAIAAWGGAMLPTGHASGEPAGMTGSGVYSGMGGLMAVGQFGNWEASLQSGYQAPWGLAETTSATFYLGQTWLYQLQTNYKLNDAWRLGLGMGGYSGNARFSDLGVAVPVARFRVSPGIQYAWAQSGIRLATGWDLPQMGRSSLGDVSVYLVAYQYLP